MNQPDPAEIEAAAKSVREYLDFTAQIGGDILFSYRGVELRKADVETLLAALATAEQRADAAEREAAKAWGQVDDLATENMHVVFPKLAAAEQRAELAERRNILNPAATEYVAKMEQVIEAAEAWDRAWTPPTSPGQAHADWKLHEALANYHTATTEPGAEP